MKMQQDKQQEVVRSRGEGGAGGGMTSRWSSAEAALVVAGAPVRAAAASPFSCPAWCR